MLPYILLAVGFVLLIKSADFLVNGASSLARAYNISELVIGLTVVAFGTSAPELFVNILSATGGSTALALGNIIGSNIANILLILGAASVICPLVVSRGTVWKEIPLSLLAALIVWVLVNDGLIDGGGESMLSRIDGIVLLAFFVVFLYYSAGIAKKIEGLEEYEQAVSHSVGRSLLLLVAGLIGLVAGGKLIVDSAVKIATVLGVGESLIGLTIVALGTSLPELATSVVAAMKKNTEIAVGNAVGSNIFNIFFILGMTSVITPVPIQPSTNLDIGMAVLASLILFIAMFTGGKRVLERWEGIVMLVLYVAFIVYSCLLAL